MLKDFKLGPLPDVHYIPDYLSTREEQSLIDQITASKARWTQVGDTLVGTFSSIVQLLDVLDV